MAKAHLIPKHFTITYDVHDRHISDKMEKLEAKHARTKLYNITKERLLYDRTSHQWAYQPNDPRKDGKLLTIEEYNLADSQFPMLSVKINEGKRLVEKLTITRKADLC